MQVPNNGFFSPLIPWILNILLRDYQIVKANLCTVMEGKGFFYPEGNRKCGVELWVEFSYGCSRLFRCVVQDSDWRSVRREVGGQLDLKGDQPALVLTDTVLCQLLSVRSDMSKYSQAVYTYGTTAGGIYSYHLSHNFM